MSQDLTGPRALSDFYASRGGAPLWFKAAGSGAASALIDVLRRGQLDCVLLALPFNCGEVDCALLFDDPLYVAYPSRRGLPPRTRAVIDYLAELLGEDPAMTPAGAVVSAR